MRQLGSFLLLLAVVITSANAAEQTKATSSSPKALFQVAQSSDLFGYKLLHQLELQERSQREENGGNDPKNLLISSFSLSTALTMAMTGAQGDTYEEMRSVLRLNNSQITEPELIAACSRLLHRINSSPLSSTVLQLASAVALQDNYHLLPTFLDVVESDFHSKLFSVNFSGDPKAAIEKINSWAGEKTHGKIPILFEEEQLNKDTKLVLLNALYFKGAWAEKFKKKHTTEEEFTWSEEKKFNVSMMHKELISLRQTTTEEGHQLVELPYRGEVQSMLLFLPNETFLAGNSSTTTTTTTTTTITSAFYRAIKKHKALSKMRSKWVDLSLPRFKIESDSFQQLKNILQKMGLRAAFEGGVADFSRGMTGGKGLKIAQVVQKTMIEVNEAGADVAAAAASPAVPFNYYSLPLPPTSMHFNRPFLFAIRDNRLYVNLFVGIVNKPEGGSEVGAKEEDDDDDDGEKKIFYY